MIWLAAAFLVTALLYASVGFGGGSTYSALLALSGVDYRVLPLVSLACNIVVVAGATIRFARAKVTPSRGALVLTALAAPAAFLGGLTPIGEASFLMLLGASLVLTGLMLMLPVRAEQAGEPSRAARFMPFAAAPLGYLAGLVGIGGGIFLAPLLHITRWNNARAVAATASLLSSSTRCSASPGISSKAGRNGSRLRRRSACRCCWRSPWAARSAAYSRCATCRWDGSAGSPPRSRFGSGAGCCSERRRKWLPELDSNQRPSD